MMRSCPRTMSAVFGMNCFQTSRRCSGHRVQTARVVTNRTLSPSMLLHQDTSCMSFTFRNKQVEGLGIVWKSQSRRSGNGHLQLVVTVL
ncbi:hypothetical protein GDO81_024930 [Engystomops pustulosus]|uniref:Secreted protein n=1 Tax=Engystomops pustulosus TaxID=76066 RepID=A0AAV6YPM8_ENGPU|nr:hypothetical protein GDO81_024930 [Engystomops pustulosus]